MNRSPKRRAWVSRAAVLLMGFGVALPHTDAPLLAQRSDATPEQFGGEVQLGSEPPFPVHLEIRRSQPVEGVISTPGASFKLVEGIGTDIVVGRIRGEGGNGTITLRFSPRAVDGSFELEGQKGTLRARRTDKDSAAFFKDPEQKLDLTTKQWREDLDRLVKILTTHHGSPFHRTPKDKFYAQVERVRGILPRLNGPQVALELVKLGALIGDGHTWVAYPRGRPRFNFDTYWFEDGLRVVGIDAAHKDLLGARLVAIDDDPVSEVVRRLRVFAAQGETAWGYRSVAPYLLGSAEMLTAVGVGRGSSREFTFETMNGNRERVSLLASTEKGQRAILGGGAPLWDRGTEAFAVQRLSDGTVYVNWRAYDNLEQNVATLLSDVDKQRPTRLIIDLRDNGGGDYNFGRQFISQLTARDWLNRPDKLFVLIGRQTFSAAMTNAVDFKRSSRASLIGEPPGAAPNNWQELRRFHLPNSGIAVDVSTKYYEFLPGESAVRPDVHLPPYPSDWGAPYDSAVRYILALPCRAGATASAAQ